MGTEVKRCFGILFLIAVTAAGQTKPPASFSDLSARAQQAYKAQNNAEALRLFAAAVKLRPTWTEGWWALGMIHYQQDQYAECRDSLRKMVKLAPAAAPGWSLLGLCEYRTKEYKNALRDLKKAHMLVPPKEPGGPLLDMANYRLAELLTQEGAFEVAENIYIDVALYEPHNKRMMFGAGVAALRMPIFPSQVPKSQHEVVSMAGKAFWDLITQHPQKAQADFKALVAAYPKFPNVHYFYGTYLAAHRPSLSDHQFLAELKVSPDSVPARVSLVLRYIKEGKQDEALKLANEAVALSPDSVGSQLALAQALQAKGQYKQALASYLAAEKLDPNSPKIRLFTASIYRQLGNLKGVQREQAAYQRLKAESPNWP
jgi:tetratricopeptide (TPR) repeat protein